MEALFDKERKARTDGNISELEQIHVQIIEACASENEIIAALRSLINKRKQDHQSIRKVVQKVFNEHKNIQFCKDLLTKVIEGRIFLEEERLDVADNLKTLLGNNINESYEIIKQVPVETFTTISEKKRSDFLFEQIRLAILLQDLQEAELFIRKVRRSSLEKMDTVIFLNYYILLRIAQQSFLEAAKLFIELNSIDENKKHITMGSIYCIMSNCLLEKRNVKEERRRVLKQFFEFKNNDELMRAHTKAFCSDLIINFDVAKHIGERAKAYNLNVDTEVLLMAILEHNFQVISKFYFKIRVSEAVELLNITEAQLIDFISEMVNEKYSSAKINQKDMVISFESKKWNSKVDKVLDKIVSVNYLIHKETLDQ